jgi:hypothetical protein
MQEWMRSSSQNNRVEFLAETRYRNFENARRACDTVIQLMQGIPLNIEQSESIQEKLTLLRSRLEAAGQKF